MKLSIRLAAISLLIAGAASTAFANQTYKIDPAPSTIGFKVHQYLTTVAGKLDLFFEADIAIAPSRKSNLHTLTEVALRNPFGGIRKNYLRTQTAAYFVELIEVCTERDHHEPELFGLLRRAFGYLDANEPNLRAVSHFEAELARITGVHDAKLLKSNPAFALGNLFGKLPLSRTPLLKALAPEAKHKLKEAS